MRRYRPVFVSRYMPCESCGESLDRAASDTHECAPEKLADFQMFTMRHDIAELVGRYHDYLRSPHGRFEVWLAARHVHRTR
jgi:hypothetical protein